MNVYKVLHLSRSGGHVFCNWIMFHYPSGIHSNCVKHPNLGKFKLSRFWLPDLVDPRKDGTERLTSGKSPDPRTGNTPAHAVGYPVWVLSAENCKNPELSGSWDEDWGPQPNIYCEVILIRSYLNTMASRIKADSKRPSAKTRPGPELWKSHANAALSKLYVYFDKWIVDYEYRRQVERDLWLPPNTDADLALDVVPNDAGGSSFDGTRIDDVREGILTRWKHVSLPDGWAEDQETQRLEEQLR